MKKAVVIYDDSCAFCMAQVRRLAWLDWLHALEFLPASSPAAVRAASGLTPEGLLREIHCVTPRGDVLRAARAFRCLMLRLPLLAPLALLMWLPGVLPIAEAVYRWVACNRSLLR